METNNELAFEYVTTTNEDILSIDPVLKSL